MRTEVARADTRDVILDAAERLLSLYGYTKTTVDDIAREAGIGKGTIYLHFHGKDEIAVSWIDRLNQRVRARLREIAASSDTPAHRLHDMLCERVMIRSDSARNHTKSIDELLATVRPLLLDCRKRWHEAEAEVFAEMLREGKTEGSLQLQDEMATARIMILATNSLLPSNLSIQQLGEREEIARTAAQMADMILSGLLAR